MPITWATGIGEFGDVLALAEAVTKLYDAKKEGYRLAILEAEQRANDIARQYAARNGQSETPMPDVLSGYENAVFRSPLNN
jgi:hypothetical protein